MVEPYFLAHVEICEPRGLILVSYAIVFIHENVRAASLSFSFHSVSVTSCALEGDRFAHLSSKLQIIKIYSGSPAKL